MNFRRIVLASALGSTIALGAVIGISYAITLGIIRQLVGNELQHIMQHPYPEGPIS